MAKRTPWTNEEYAVLHTAMNEMDVFGYVDSDYEQPIKNFDKNVNSVAEITNRTPRAICDKMAERYSEREIRSLDEVENKDRVFSTLHRSVEHKLYSLYRSFGVSESSNKAFSKRVKAAVEAVKDLEKYNEGFVSKKTKTKLSKENIDDLKKNFSFSKMPKVSNVTSRSLISVSEQSDSVRAYRKR